MEREFFWAGVALIAIFIIAVAYTQTQNQATRRTGLVCEACGKALAPPKPVDTGALRP